MKKYFAVSHCEMIYFGFRPTGRAAAARLKNCLYKKHLANDESVKPEGIWLEMSYKHWQSTSRRSS